MIHGAAVVAAEPVAPIVAAADILSTATDDSQSSAVGPDFHVMTGRVHGFAGSNSSQLAKVFGRGAVQRMIEPVAETVGPMLWVPDGETAIPSLAFVCAAVAVAITSKENLGSRD